MTDRVERVINAIADEIQSHCLDAWSSATETALARAAIAALDAEPRRLTATEATLLLFAARYAMGRMSMAPSIVDTYICEHMDSLSDADRRQLAHEIDEYEARYSLGMDCDVARWHALRDALRGGE